MADDELSKLLDEHGPCAMVSKKMAARLQIVTACSCLAEGNWVCAITLAGAAEGQMPEAENAKMPDFFNALKKLESSKTRFKSERNYGDSALNSDRVLKTACETHLYF
jgi:hypothetical protein